MDRRNELDFGPRRCAGDSSRVTCNTRPVAMVTVHFFHLENGMDTGTFFCASHLDMLPIEGMAQLIPSGSICVTAAGV